MNYIGSIEVGRNQAVNPLNKIHKGARTRSGVESVFALGERSSCGLNRERHPTRVMSDVFTYRESLGFTNPAKGDGMNSPWSF